jgi:hypothetical protein
MTPETTRSGGNASIASRSDAIHTFRQRLDLAIVTPLNDVLSNAWRIRAK